MKTKFYALAALVCLLTIVFLTNSCSNDESIPESVVNLKRVNVNLVIPDGANFNAKDLKVSTILTESASVTNSEAIVEIFDDNAIELTFATNSVGEIVLMGYFNPKKTESVTLNTESTALALIMLHPWTMNLTVEGKEDAISKIKTLSGFSNFKKQVEKSIKSGNLETLSTNEILDKIKAIQHEMLQRITKTYKPLHFDIDKSKITVKNEYSSAAYGIAIYDYQNNYIKHETVLGLSKLQATLNAVTSNSFLTTAAPTLELNTPTKDGKYIIKAKSGLSFDDSKEDIDARSANAEIFLSNVIGIFSEKLKALVRLKTGACEAEVLALMKTYTDGGVALRKLSENEISLEDFTKDYIFFFANKSIEIVKIVNYCDDKNYSIKAGSLRKIAKFLGIYGKLESSFNGGAHLVDWVQYDREIETCFNRNGDTISDCDEDCDKTLRLLTNCDSQKWKVIVSISMGNTVTSEIGNIWTFNKDLTFTNPNISGPSPFGHSITNTTNFWIGDSPTQFNMYTYAFHNDNKEFEIIKVSNTGQAGSFVRRVRWEKL